MEYQEFISNITALKSEDVGATEGTTAIVLSIIALFASTLFLIISKTGEVDAKTSKIFFNNLLEKIDMLEEEVEDLRKKLELSKKESGVLRSELDTANGRIRELEVYKNKGNIDKTLGTINIKEGDRL